MLRLAAHRSRTILLVVMAVLFSQLALASYVCPSGATRSSPVMMEMAPGEPCEGMAQGQDEQQPMLCYQHCNAAPQASELVKLPVVSLPAIIHILVMPLAVASAQTERLAPAHADPQPPPEPVFLSTLRLRV